MNPSPFAWYEEVMIASSDNALSEINGERGVILGMAEADGLWSYAVLIESTNICWSVEATALLTTGRIRKREELYANTSIRVSREGRILD